MGLIAYGTQVYRKTDGAVVIVPPNVEYVPKEGEVLVHEVRYIRVDFPADGAITAQIELYPTQDVIIEAIPRYVFIGHQGKPKTIKRVLFDDLSSWTPDGPECVDATTFDCRDTYRKVKSVV